MPTTGPFRTRADLVNRVLSILGVLSVGQPTDPEDYSKVDNMVDSYARTLGALGIVHLPDLNNIPSELFVDVSYCMAGMSCMEFGMTGTTAADMINEGVGGATGPAGPIKVGAGTSAQSLKQMLYGRYTGETLRAEYL